MTDWVAGSAPTIADLAMYPYTRLSGETGLDTQKRRQAISGWLVRVESVEGFLPVYSDAATEVIGFEQYFST